MRAVLRVVLGMAVFVVLTYAAGALIAPMFEQPPAQFTPARFACEWVWFWTVISFAGGVGAGVVGHTKGFGVWLGLVGGLLLLAMNVGMATIDGAERHPPAMVGSVPGLLMPVAASCLGGAGGGVLKGVLRRLKTVG